MLHTVKRYIVVTERKKNGNKLKVKETGECVALKHNNNYNTCQFTIYNLL